MPASFRGGFDGSEDSHVRRAAADVAAQAVLDRLAIRLRRFVQQRSRPHDEAGNAVAALAGVVVDERLLHGVELPILRQAFDRRDLVSDGIDGQHHATVDAAAVDEHRARAARAAVADLLCRR